MFHDLKKYELIMAKILVSQMITFSITSVNNHRKFIGLLHCFLPFVVYFVLPYVHEKNELYDYQQ